MASINRPADYMGDRAASVAVSNYHDQVRWGPIVAGLVVALSTQLVLSALGAAIGLTSIGSSAAPRSDAPGIGINIGIWAIISLLVSLFVGGWIAARTSGRTSRNTTLLNGAILWASMLTLSAWLLSSGVTGAFGVAASNAGDIINQTQQSNPGNIPGTTTPQTVPGNAPTITAQQTRDLAGNAAKVSWSFVLGSLLGLGAALMGSIAGFRHSRVTPADRDLS
jgi:hypothetical protein